MFRIQHFKSFTCESYKYFYIGCYMFVCSMFIHLNALRCVRACVREGLWHVNHKHAQTHVQSPVVLP